MAEFKTCPKCPPFLKKKCVEEGSCKLKSDTTKGKKGDKKPVIKGTYG